VPLPETTAVNVDVEIDNADVNTFYRNYLFSSGTVVYESIITDINTFSSEITLAETLPFLFSSEDPFRIYKNIPCEVVWAPQHFQAADKMKQVREGTVLFDQNNFYSAAVAYASDLSPAFSEVSFLGQGRGLWGNFNWGNDFWSGEGSDRGFRTLIPLEKQRCRYLTCRFKHVNARESFRLLGISLEPRAISTRAYR
jgi:hypothetical protein